MNCRNFFIITFVLMAESFALSFEVNLFDFKEVYPQENNGDMHTVASLVRRALEFGLDSREKMQILFQARTDIRVKLGCVMPQVAVLQLLSAVENAMMNSALQFANSNLCADAAVPLVGFLFPNRWFELRGSVQMRRAERASLSVLLGNCAHAVQHIYFDIQTQIWSVRVLEFYIEELKKLIGLLKEQKAEGVSRAKGSDIAVLENILGHFEAELAYVDALSAEIPKLETVINLDLDFDWESIIVEPHFFNIENKQPKNYEEIFPLVLKRSKEIKNIKQLIKNAKSEKRAVYFDVFDPLTYKRVGFSQPQRIKICASNINVLKMEKKRTKMQLSNLIQTAINNYNNALNVITKVEEGMSKLSFIKDAINKNINDLSSDLDIVTISLYFKYAKKQAINFLNLYISLMEAETDFARFTWTGDIYNLVKDFEKNDLPKILKETKKKHTLRRKVKNKFRKQKPNNNTLDERLANCDL